MRPKTRSQAVYHRWKLSNVFLRRSESLFAVSGCEGIWNDWKSWNHLRVWIEKANKCCENPISVDETLFKFFQAYDALRRTAYFISSQVLLACWKYRESTSCFCYGCHRCPKGIILIRLPHPGDKQIWSAVPCGRNRPGQTHARSCTRAQARARDVLTRSVWISTDYSSIKLITQNWTGSFACGIVKKMKID